MTPEEAQILGGWGGGLKVEKRMEGKEKWNRSFKGYRCYNSIAGERNMMEIF